MVTCRTEPGQTAVWTASVAAAAFSQTGRPGAAQLAEVARAELRLPGETRSGNEKALLRLVRAAKLPLPEVNVRVGRYTVDALWRTCKLAVEIDSFPYHGTKWSVESDRARDLELESAGFTVMRITADQLERESLMVLARVSERLGALRARTT